MVDRMQKVIATNLNTRRSQRRGYCQGHDSLLKFGTPLLTLEWMKLDTSDIFGTWTIASINQQKKIGQKGQGHG